MADQWEGFESIAVIPTEQLREQWRRTMVMGLPAEDTEKPTFVFEREVEFARHDTEGSPWDWEAAPIAESSPASVQPICAYEFFSPLGRQGSFLTEVGEFNPTTVVFTLLEDEFEAISGFTYATVGPDDTRWFFRHWRPAQGLNDLTVYEVHCVAEGIA